MKTKYHTLQKGFTLIELMIVIAIIGVLAAFALPMYNDFIAKSQAGEAFHLADIMKIQVMENLANDQCQSNSGTSNKIAGKYVNLEITGITGAPCEITATFKADNISDKIANKQLILYVTDKGSLTFDDSTTNLDKKYIPKAILPNS